jgi:UDP-N-acetyl-D-galactosamine dehydrogenase
MSIDYKKATIAIIGLGYVGLPLAVEFGKKRTVIGFDINEIRINELKQGVDNTLEVEPELLDLSIHLQFTSKVDELQQANIYIVTVPTPIDRHNNPDLRPLQKASEMIASVLNKGDIVIYESTVYPGATEEDCIPILESNSGLIFNRDFFAGYSPERINPGDKNRRVANILKITSGSTEQIAQVVDELYQEVIIAGTHKASSIKVAEAAKIIENTQRDVNIALINELSVIFNKMGINTTDVLEAAGTKWNFLPFKPGLVGGHCIGVDPYYLTHKATALGYYPEIINSSRRVNDNMGSYVSNQLVMQLVKARIHIDNANILILGLSFKENCPDVRNTKVIDVINDLESYGANISVYDPWVCKTEAKKEYNIQLIDEPITAHYDAILVTVAHQEFKEWTDDKVLSLLQDKSVIYDLKNIFSDNIVDFRL